jgi:hypothetical protein
MSKECQMTIIHLCCVFKKLCVRIVDLATMGELKKEVAIFKFYWNKNSLLFL